MHCRIWWWTKYKLLVILQSYVSAKSECATDHLCVGRMVLLRFCLVYKERVLVLYNSVAILHHERILPGHQCRLTAGDHQQASTLADFIAFYFFLLRLHYSIFTKFGVTWLLVNCVLVFECKLFRAHKIARWPCQNDSSFAVFKDC